MKNQQPNPCQNQEQKKEATSGDRQHVLNPKFLHVIENQQNTIISSMDTYRFKKGNGKDVCDKCDLWIECANLFAEKDFPFPCVAENRLDGRNGYFKKKPRPEDVMFRQFIVTFIAFVLLVLMVVLDIIPDWLNYLLFELWH